MQKDPPTRVKSTNAMSMFRRSVMWAALALIIALIFLSIYGAFIGPERAQQFFNSLPLAVYWIAFILLLIVGMVIFRKFISVPALLLIHAGCLLVLAGAVWSSEAGHELQKKLFGIDRVPKGQMVVFEQSYEDRVTLESTEQVRKLPFRIKLKDFRIDYYKPGYLLVQSRKGKTFRFVAEIGKEYFLGDDLGALKIVRAFENFKIRIEEDGNVPYDDTGPGDNPALEVQIITPTGQTKTRYVFALSPGHIHRDVEPVLRYYRPIRDYVSELQIIEDDKVVVEKDIEVNHPLYYGGYHFYQYSYDDQAGQYTVLMVVSDTGLNAVYLGYLLLCGGVFWHFWLRDIFAAIKAKSL